MIQHTRKPVIDFAHYISMHTEGFTGREWILQAINDWFAKPDGSRYFLLTGEPGSGKTAVASRLVQLSQERVSPSSALTSLTPHFLSAFYFCSARDSRWVNPFVFAESLALQLAERYPTYAKTLAEKSEDRQIHIEVQQRIEQGQAVGVVINRLNVSGGRPEDAFNRVVREPLEALFQHGFDQQIIVLIDGLDEALDYGGNGNIIALLSHLHELPSAVRFLLTSRQDARIVNAFFDADELVLSAAPYEQRNQEDIRQYVKERFGNDERLAMKAAELDADFVSEKVVETIVGKAEGNFLYTRFLLDSIVAGKRPLLELEGLPEGLDGLYYESLQRVVQLGKGEWPSEYAPLIGMLSVAQESPTFALFQSFTKQSTAMVLKHLDDLGQFVEEMKLPGAGEGCYRLYHQSIIDFLHRQTLSLREKKVRNPFYLPANEWHKALADWCEIGNLTAIWEETMLNSDERGRRMYARRFYIFHLYQAHTWQRLFEVLDEGQYGRAKMQADPSMQGYAQDLDLGRKAASWDGWTLEEKIEYLPHLWHYTLLRCSLTSQVDAYPDNAFTLLLLLNRDMEAIRSAELLTHPAHKARVFLLIARFFIAQPERLTEGLQLLEQVYACIQSISSPSERDELSIMLGQELIKANHWSLAQQVITSIQGSIKKARALTVLGQALLQADHWNQAIQVWQQALKAMAHYDYMDKDRNKALMELGQLLVQANQWQLVQEVLASIPKIFSWWYEAAKELSQALVHAHRWQEAQEMILSIQLTTQTVEAAREFSQALVHVHRWQEAQEMILSIQNIAAKGEALTELGQMLAQANYMQQAMQVWQQAQEAIASIQNTDRKNEALSLLGQALAKAKQWQLALKVIISIYDEAKSTKALEVLLGEVLAQDESRQLIQEVLTFLQKGYRKDEALCALGIALAQANHWSLAQEMIVSIRESAAKAQALIKLGQMLAQADHTQQAMQVWQQSRKAIASIDKYNTHAKNQILNELGQVLTQACCWQEAQEVVVSIPDNYVKDKALQALVFALGNANRWQQAQEVLTSIQDRSKKDEALCVLANALSRANHWSLAQEAIASVQDNTKRAEALCVLANALAQVNHKQQAIQIWQQVQKVIFSRQDRSARNRAVRELGLALAQIHRWQEARDVIISINHSADKAEALRELDQLQAKASQEAQGIVLSIKDNLESVAPLRALVRKLIRTNQWQKAQEVISSIKDSSEKAMVLSALSQALTGIDCGQTAEKVITSIKDSSRQAEALSALGIILAQTNYEQQAREVLQRARKVIASIKDSEWYTHEQAKALSKLGQTLAKACLWQEAQEVIASINAYPQKAEALMVLGQELARTGQEQQAVQIWRQARQAIRWDSSNEYSPSEASILEELAHILIQAKQWQLAREVIASIDYYDQGFHRDDPMRQEELERKGIPTNYVKDEVLGELGQGLAQALLWQEAREVIASIKRSDLRIEASGTLGLALAQANLWPEAQEVIDSLTDGLKAAILSKLGRVLLETDQWQIAWQQTQKIIASISRGNNKDEALSMLGEVLIQGNHWQEAQEVFVSIQDKFKKAKALSALGQTLTQVSHEKQAIQVWHLAQEAIASIQDKSDKVEALRELGQALAQANQWQWVGQIWQEMPEVIVSISNHSQKVEALGKLGQTLTQIWNQGQEANTIIQPSMLRERNSIQEKVEVHLQLVQQIWLHLTSSDEALSAFSLAHGLICSKLVQASIFYQAFGKVDAFLEGGDETSS